MKKVAVSIENGNQLRNYKMICEANNILYSAPKDKSLTYPHYHLIMPVGDSIYSLYNDKLDGHHFSVLTMGYFLYPFSLFKKDISSFLNPKEDFYEN